MAKFEVTFADGHFLDVETDDAEKAAIIAEAWTIKSGRQIWTAEDVVNLDTEEEFTVIHGGVIAK